MKEAMAIAVCASLAKCAFSEAWYVPGWMRTQTPEGGAWSSFTNVFSSSECAFWQWDGDELWQKAVRNADAAGRRLARDVRSLPAGRRDSLVLVGHSLGGRVIARALADLGATGDRIAAAALLAPAIPANDPDVVKMGAGSKSPVILVVNPQDITLKYVYAAAGGESGQPLGANGTPAPVANVREFSVPSDITDTTAIHDAWGSNDTIKRIANHHASFYFAELGRILDGKPSKNVQMVVPQGNVNIESKVVDAGVWWDVLDYSRGWKLERNILTGHCRILNPSKRRIAWGSEARMRESFAKVKRQLQQQP